MSYEEVAAQRRTEEVAYSHLSLEVDHLYMEDFLKPATDLVDRIMQLAPWYRMVTESFRRRFPDVRAPRISTCFLVDDYFSELIEPAKLIEGLVQAAAMADVRIDYLARESACARANGTEIAQLVAGRLVSVPVPETTGSRPPTAETGWLSNGLRSPAEPTEALSTRTWRPPLEAGSRTHSIFVDVQLWSEEENGRLWSCPMLAAVWQLLRLGLLRDNGRPVIQPEPLPEVLPATWAEMPPLVRLNPAAPPFHGYHTVSLLESRFLPVEHAVRVILEQVAQDEDVMGRVARRARGENFPLADEVTDRIAYVFTEF